MSRAAGTLQTTYNATYYPPSLMPGYRGHVPTTQFQYGETFGNVTAKYFQDYRSETLTSSQSPYARGGYFPTPYTNQPELVMSDRRRSHDQYLFSPKQSLTTTNVDRTNEIRQFHQLSQEQRDTYIDRSGTLHPIEHFTVPIPNTAMYEANLPYSSMLLRHTSDVNIPVNQNFPPVKHVPKQSEFQLFPPTGHQ